MVITLRCPNGHKLTCPDDRVGQTGKCPRCGVGFQVPQSSQSTQWVDTERSASEIGDSHARGFSDAEDVIVFLCPNGHKLHGPKSLQGRPGQCPHCNSKFLIPNYDDDSEELIEEPQLLPLDGDEVPLGETAAVEAEEKIASEDTRISSSRPVAPASSSGIGQEPRGTHPMAAIFAKLWEQRKGDAPIEIRLKSGQVVIPASYSRQDASGQRGLFGVKNSNGSYMLTAIAWDAVEQISLNGLSELPAELFD